MQPHAPDGTRKDLDALRKTVLEDIKTRGVAFFEDAATTGQ